MSEPISSIRNLGPAYEKSLNAVGVMDADALRNIGADTAYAMLLEAGERPHFIGYYVLVMALQGRPWNDCKGKEKAELRVKFDAMKAKHKPQAQSAIERELDAIGVGLKR